MSIWTHKEKDGKYVVICMDVEHKDKKELIEVEDEDIAQKIEEAFAKLEGEYQEREYITRMELQAATKIVEFYQKLIVDTLNDKLSEIDNMYAMKTMLKEIESTIKSMIPALEELKEKQEVEKSN